MYALLPESRTNLEIYFENSNNSNIAGQASIPLAKRPEVCAFLAFFAHTSGEKGGGMHAQGLALSDFVDQIGGFGVGNPAGAGGLGDVRAETVA